MVANGKMPSGHKLQFPFVFYQLHIMVIFHQPLVWMWKNGKETKQMIENKGGISLCLKRKRKIEGKGKITFIFPYLRK